MCSQATPIRTINFKLTYPVDFSGIWSGIEIKKESTEEIGRKPDHFKKCKHKAKN